MTFMLRAWLLMVTEEPRSTSKPESVSVIWIHNERAGRNPSGMVTHREGIGLACSRPVGRLSQP